MGHWTLESVTGQRTLLDDSECGHDFKVTFQLHYQPSRFDRFVETPRLEWKEEVYTIERHEGKYWTFKADMYALNPVSKTLRIWAARYVAAYDRANNMPYYLKGEAKLLDNQRMLVKRSALRNETDAKQKADAVRDYLKNKGGYLVIQIHDIPSFNKPEQNNTQKERLLTFDCGVKGCAKRYKAFQYLKVHGTNSSNWERNLTEQNPTAAVLRILEARKGLTQVSPPQKAWGERKLFFGRGECW